MTSKSPFKAVCQLTNVEEITEHIWNVARAISVIKVSVTIHCCLNSSEWVKAVENPLNLPNHAVLRMLKSRNGPG